MTAIAQHPGEEAYITCAACHLPSGEGVSGVFPPVAERVEQIALTEAGRAYLAAVVVAGLTGPMQVQGVNYMGTMPGSVLTPLQVAQVLNYIAQELGDQTAEDFEAFTEEEVQLLSEGQDFNMVSNAALRAELAEDLEALR